MKTTEPGKMQMRLRGPRGFLSVSVLGSSEICLPTRMREEKSAFKV
jgi:hypothetical protein